MWFFRRSLPLLRCWERKCLGVPRYSGGCPTSHVHCSSTIPDHRGNVLQVSSRGSASMASTSSSSSTQDAADELYHPRKAGVEERFPVVQLPARSLWCPPFPIPKEDLDPSIKHIHSTCNHHNPDADSSASAVAEMIKRVKDTRHYYQYPSMCAPQVGWNVQMFTLFDNSVYINPICLDVMEWKEEAEKKGVPYLVYEKEKLSALRSQRKTCFAWEPCASCAFLIHYIERPLTCRLQALDEEGKLIVQTLEGMKARMAWHEMDHLQGILFSRRVVDANHVVPLEGFCSMSDWSDDYPSLEARSTFLYTLFTPPFFFQSYGVEDANLLDRHLEDGIYPGKERDAQMRIEHAAMEHVMRSRWKAERERQCMQQDASKVGDI